MSQNPSEINTFLLVHIEWQLKMKKSIMRSTWYIPGQLIGCTQVARVIGLDLRILSFRDHAGCHRLCTTIDYWLQSFFFLLIFFMSFYFKSCLISEWLIFFFGGGSFYPLMFFCLCYYIEEYLDIRTLSASHSLALTHYLRHACTKLQTYVCTYLYLSTQPCRNIG